MRGEVTVLIVCVCVSVTALAGATRTLFPQSRCQKKALDARIKMKDGIELKFLSSKVMTVCKLFQNFADSAEEELYARCTRPFPYRAMGVASETSSSPRIR